MAASDADKVMVVFDLDACCWYPEMYQLWFAAVPTVLTRCALPPVDYNSTAHCTRALRTACRASRTQHH